MIRQAVILAGGKGERLRPLTDKLPKPMAPVSGIPFLEYQVETIRRAGIQKVLFLVGYRAEVIQRHFGAMKVPGMKFDFSVGTEDDLTGKRVLQAKDKLTDAFLLMYGDNYLPEIPIKEMHAAFERSGASVQTTIFKNLTRTGEYGPENNVEYGPDWRVIRYDKSRKSAGLNGLDIGYFLVRKSKVDFSIRDNVSFEEALLPKFIDEKKLYSYPTDQQYHYITDLDCLTRFEKLASDRKLPYLTQAAKRTS